MEHGSNSSTDSNSSTLVPALPPLPYKFESESQLELYEILVHVDPVLARMYAGGLYALIDTQNPEQFVHAALSFRELMVKAPAKIEVPEERQRRVTAYNLGQEVNLLSTKWENVVADTICLSNDRKWNGEIDEPLKRGLKAVDKFLQKYRRLRPGHRENIKALAVRVDQAPVPPSSRSQEHFAKEWLDVSSFFNSVLHHGKETDLEEMNDNVQRLERVIRIVIAPPAVSTQKKIDALIAAAEK